VISVTDGKTTLRYQTRQTLFNIQPLRMEVMSELRVVTMIDLEEIDYLSAAPGTDTSARKIRANKKNIAKALARGQSIPSWKRSLASLRGQKTRTRGWLDQKVI
jgi:hypothetical protein